MTAKYSKKCHIRQRYGGWHLTRALKVNTRVQECRKQLMWTGLAKYRTSIPNIFWLILPSDVNNSHKNAQKVQNYLVGMFNQLWEFYLSCMYNAILAGNIQKNAHRKKKNARMSEGYVIKTHAGSPICPQVEDTNAITSLICHVMSIQSSKDVDGKG